MSVMLTLQKHLKMTDAEVRSSFDPQSIPFIPKTFDVKTENAQEFKLLITAAKKLTYKFKVHAFSNGSPEDMLE
eukprot:15342320-Ditylum_brightwellii.AAC.2